MSDSNPFVTNGECFFGFRLRLDRAYYPCGNAELGHKTCCMQTDMCLSSNACYNEQFDLTYLAGCSDPEYEHESCPDKGEFDGSRFP